MGVFCYELWNHNEDIASDKINPMILKNHVLGMDCPYFGNELIQVYKKKMKILLYNNWIHMYMLVFPSLCNTDILVKTVLCTVCLIHVSADSETQWG